MVFKKASRPQQDHLYCEEAVCSSCCGRLQNTNTLSDCLQCEKNYSLPVCQTELQPTVRRGCGMETTQSGKRRGSPVKCFASKGTHQTRGLNTMLHRRERNHDRGILTVPIQTELNRVCQGLKHPCLSYSAVAENMVESNLLMQVLLVQSGTLAS